MVLGPNVVAFLCMKPLGIAEADLALSGGVLAGNLGKRLLRNGDFFDDGTLEGAFGSFKYDDEGVPAQRRSN